MRKTEKAYYLDYYRRYPEDALYGHCLSLKYLGQDEVAELCFQIVLEKGLLKERGCGDGEA